MTERFDTTTSTKVNDFIAEKYADNDVVIHSVEGGYSRNRRAIIDVNGESVFAKEVDMSVLDDEGATELGWLKKDYEITSELASRGVEIVPNWAELHLGGHLLLLPSYKKEDGWLWTLPDDGANAEREVMSLKYTKEINDVFADGDTDAIYAGLMATRPAYGGTKWTLDELREEMK